MILHGMKRFIAMYGMCFLFAQVLWAQDTFYDPRRRSYLQNQTPESLYQQNVEVPNLLQGQPKPEETGKQLEEVAPTVPLEIRFDKKVDPDQYIVGPGDYIGLYLWGDLDKEFLNRVTPEGLLIFPTVGDVMVSDMTITEVSKKVKEKVNNHYKGIESTVYLFRPRMFRLYISGLVLNPGMINASSFERVSDIIDRAGLKFVEEAAKIAEVQNISLGRIENVDEITKKGSSQRTIKVFRGDKVLDVDLLRFMKAGDLDANPYVAMGDRIQVPEYGGDIIITGEANDPNRYEFKSGDRIADLVVFGGGLTVIADTTRATLVRFHEDGHTTYNIPIDLYDAVMYNPDDPQYRLKESDRLFVRRKYKFKNKTSVILSGEIKFPGEYATVPEETKLSEVIAQAGGFSDEANLSEARMTRRYSAALSDLELPRLQRMQRWEMTDEEYDYYRSRSRLPSGKLTIDFVKLFNDHDTTYDIVLLNGDNIYIPMKREFVQVSGAVVIPGYVRLKTGENIPYYVSLAGGFKYDANAGKVRIIKGKTGQRFKPGKDIIIEGGDIIHVPEKVPIEKWQTAKDTALLFANLATVIILAQQLTR